MKKHWLAIPKPFIAWWIFMGLMTGGTFAVAGIADVPRGRGRRGSSLHACRSPIPSGLHRLRMVDDQRLKKEQMEPHLPNHATSPFGATCSFLTPHRRKRTKPKEA